jgi:hypothetical protein
MADSGVLVIYENGDRIGHITATGKIGYAGSNQYVEMILERFEGGEANVYSDEAGEKPSGPGTKVMVSTGADLFASVRSRFEPLSHIEVAVESNTSNNS